MKKIYLFILLSINSFVLMAQNNDSTFSVDSIPYYVSLSDSYGQIGTRSSPMFSVGEFIPPKEFILSSDSTFIRIIFDGDSLVVKGDMKMTESAKIFIDYCRRYFSTKIDSLEYQIELIKSKYSK